MKTYLAYIVGFFLLIGAIMYGYYQFKRTWNYTWAYEARVEQTANERICAMVKPEHLVDPSICK